MSETPERPVPWAKFIAEYEDVFAAKTTPAWLHRCRDENGLTACGALVKRGGRWYVWPSRFWAWFAGSNRAAA
jgi:hypothetical protein